MCRIKLSDGSFTTLEPRRVIKTRICPDWNRPGVIVFKIDILRTDGRCGSRAIFPDETITPEIMDGLKSKKEIYVRVTRCEEKKIPGQNYTTEKFYCELL